MTIRPYTSDDYESIADLYKNSDTYGGQFDELVDSKEKLAANIKRNPGSILVAEINETIIGTITLFEDGRNAWFFRFAVLPGEHEQAALTALHDAAITYIKERGHDIIKVYAPAGNQHFSDRYANLGFTKGGDYTCFWKTLE